MDALHNLEIYAIDTIATGKFMKELCRQEGIKVSWLAQQFGVTEQAVYSWFRGQKMPQVELAIAFARLFNLHLEELYIDCQGQHAGQNKEEDEKSSSVVVYGGILQNITNNRYIIDLLNDLM